MGRLIYSISFLAILTQNFMVLSAFIFCDRNLTAIKGRIGVKLRILPIHGG